MAKKKKKESKFRYKKGATSAASKKQRYDGGYGYLKLPENVKQFSEKKMLFDEVKKDRNKGRVKMDIMAYIVSMKNHPDYTDEFETPAVGDPWFRFPFLIHRNIGGAAEGRGGDTVICPKSINLPCPICEARQVMVQEKRDKEEIKSLNHGFRSIYVVNPIAVGGEEFDTQDAWWVWDVSDHCFFKQLKRDMDEDPDYESFWHPDGFSLRIRFDLEAIGSGKNMSEFASATRIDFDKRQEPYDEDLIEQAPDLGKIIKNSVLSYKELEAKFYGVDEEDVVEDEDEGEDEKPARKPKAKEEDADDEDLPTEWDELVDMSRKELKELAEHLDLDTKGTVHNLRESIADELEIDMPEEEEEEEEEDEAEDEEEEGVEIPDAKALKGMKVKELKAVVKEHDLGLDYDDYDSKKEFVEDIVDALHERYEDSPEAAGTKEPAPDSKPSKSSSKGKDKEKGKKKGECPHGHEFGTDCEEYDECDECDKWDACIDVKEQNE